MRFIVPVLMVCLFVLLVIAFLQETQKTPSLYYFTHSSDVAQFTGSRLQTTEGELITPIVDVRLTDFNGARGVASFEVECTYDPNAYFKAGDCDSIVLIDHQILGTNLSEKSISFRQQKKYTWITSARGLPVWFPFDEFDMYIPLRGRLYLRILGNVAGFQHEIKNIEDQHIKEEDISLAINIHLRRSFASIVFSTVLLLSASLLGWIYAWKHRGRDPEGIIGGAGYLLSMWGIRQIVADANITFPTLFDGLLIASFLIYGIIVFSPFRNRTIQPIQNKSSSPPQRAKKTKRR